MLAPPAVVDAIKMAAKKDSHISRTPLLGRLEVELSGACDHGSTRQNNVELTSFPTSNSFPTIAFIPSRTSAKDLRSFERESTENATISLHQVLFCTTSSNATVACLLSVIIITYIVDI